MRMTPSIQLVANKIHLPLWVIIHTQRPTRHITCKTNMTMKFFNPIWPLHGSCHGPLKWNALGRSPASYMRSEETPPGPRGTQMRECCGTFYAFYDPRSQAWRPWVTFATPASAEPPLKVPIDKDPQAFTSWRNEVDQSAEHVYDSP